MLVSTRQHLLKKESLLYLEKQLDHHQLSCDCQADMQTMNGILSTCLVYNKQHTAHWAVFCSQAPVSRMHVNPNVMHAEACSSNHQLTPVMSPGDSKCKLID